MNRASIEAGVADRWWRTVAAALAVACLLGFGVAAAQSDAAKPGEDFLKAVDSQRYADSWDLTSDYFKQSVSKTEWASQLRQVRDPLGSIVVRSLKSSEPQKDPRGAPAGDYLLVTYQTTFSSSPELRIETLPLIKGTDGQYHVVGYFIR